MAEIVKKNSTVCVKSSKIGAKYTFSKIPRKEDISLEIMKLKLVFTESDWLV